MHTLRAGCTGGSQADRNSDARGVLLAMQDLVVSAQPAVVFISLATICVPALSDECRIVIEEDGGIGYRIERPDADAVGPTTAMGEDYLPRAGVSRQLRGEHAVRTPIVALPLVGERNYRGVLVNQWRIGYHPTSVDAEVARLVVDRAVAAVHHERLSGCLALQQNTTDNGQALSRTRDIGDALEILMTNYCITYHQAVGLLQVASEHTHHTVRDLAAEVLLTGALDVASQASPIPWRVLSVAGR